MSKPLSDVPKGTAIKFGNPQFGRLGKHIAYAASLGLPMVEKDCRKGARGALICAQGPSITRPGVMRRVRHYAKAGWTVFAIKEVIAYLEERGITVHYSVAMDPGPHQVARTPVFGHVVYCIASSCHPELFDHVLASGAQVLVYHSACGFVEREVKPGFVLDLGGDQAAIVLGEFEMHTTDGTLFAPVCGTVRQEVDVYRARFPCADVIVGGFMVGNRALGLAKYMGFERVVLAGFDFGWRDDGRGDDRMRYADFVKYAGLRDVFMTDCGRVDGKPWRTRPDMLASAVDVARHIKSGEVKVLGDSLANALAKHDDAYLDRVVQIKH